jgi:hypothetical protein
MRLKKAEVLKIVSCVWRCCTALDDAHSYSTTVMSLYRFFEVFGSCLLARNRSSRHLRVPKITASLQERHNLHAIVKNAKREDMESFAAFVKLSSHRKNGWNIGSRSRPIRPRLVRHVISQKSGAVCSRQQLRFYPVRLT